MKKSSGSHDDVIPSGAVRVLTPAKVNLFLEVNARRADGYHEVDTTMVTLDLADSVDMSVFDRAGDEEPIRLTGEGPAWSADIPTDERNLAWRAAHNVLKEARRRGTFGADKGLALHLVKHVPSGAGLGGGSSNAAGAHLAAAELTGLDPDDPTLIEGLAGLGADCAFFLLARATGHARCTGIGERIEVLAARRGPEHVLLFVPDAHVSTAAVYGALRVPSEPVANLVYAGEERASARLFNRLEAPACSVAPGLAAWRELFDELAPTRFLLSGSGSSFFAIGADEAELERLRAEVLVRAKARDLGLRCESIVRVGSGGVRHAH